MAINKTPRHQPENDDREFEFQTPTAQIFEDVDNEANGGKKVEEQDDKYEALSRQMADLQERLTTSERANMSLLSQPQGNQSQVSFVEVNPDSIALPDPALDPDGYDKAVAKRNDIRDSNRRGKDNFEAKRKQEFEEKIENLWEDFAENYPLYAVDKEKIDFVATKVTQAAIKKGLDVNRYMFGTRDKYLSDVAKKYDEVFGEPEDDNNEDDYNDAPRRRGRPANTDTRTRTRSRNRQEEDRMDGRTGGIFGGNESGGRASRRNEREDDGPSMIDDIQALQKKTGFF